MWIACGVTPWSRITWRRSTTICCGPHRNHSSTSSAGSSASRIRRQPLAVEPAGEQLDVLLLAGEHVHQLEPVGVAVLEVLQPPRGTSRCGGCGWRRPASPAARGSVSRMRGDDREHRRDPRAGGDRDVALAVRRVELGGEPARRRHHVELVADPQHVERVLGEGAAGQPLDRDPQHARTPAGEQIE